MFSKLNNNNKIINDGDRVLIYFNKETMKLISIKSGQTFNSKFGAFQHKRLIGLEYGSRVASEDGSGFIHILRMTPELWSLSLDLRTQILFNTDISTILFNLEVKNGSRVVESGTGSGSLSTSFVRTIQPLGHLYTFEFHEERSKAAAKDFKDNGFDKNVTVTFRNVCTQGFKLNVDNMVGCIDAVFLDLPSPWEAIDHASDVLREGGMLCSFSPCIEQVQNVCLKLDSSDYQEIETLEVLIRNYDIRVQQDDELELNNPFKPFDNNDKEEEQKVVEQKQQHPKKKKKWEDGKVETFNIGGISGKTKFRVFDSPCSEERGHTGYLTFARYMPK